MHMEFGAVALLQQDAHAGSEVLDTNADTIVPTALNPDAYVVNVGDMLSK